MPLERDDAIVLRLTPYSETSQLVTLLTRGHGLLRLLAKGAHRRTKAGASSFDGGLDLLDRGACVFSAPVDKPLGLLTEWKLLDGHLSLRRGMRSLMLAMSLAEIVPMLMDEHDPHQQVFDRLAATLPMLGTAAIEEAYLSFVLDLLHDAGQMPELAACLSCGRTLEESGDAFFSSARGGIVCRNCEAAHPDRVTIDARLIRIALNLRSLPRTEGQPTRLPRLTRRQTDPLNRLMLQYLQVIQQRPIRTLKHVMNGR